MVLEGFAKKFSMQTFSTLRATDTTWKVAVGEGDGEPLPSRAGVEVSCPTELGALGTHVRPLHFFTYPPIYRKSIADEPTRFATSVALRHFWSPTSVLGLCRFFAPKVPVGLGEDHRHLRRARTDPLSAPQGSRGG